ncbi:hypothetical protein [Streptomyces sp. NPDC046197]|uniref:hypothetical protein n=1 Tax=Streptomyces sp. NPDC046197 TaxID=3154337 RepID=UPI0033F6D078
MKREGGSPPSVRLQQHVLPHSLPPLPRTPPYCSPVAVVDGQPGYTVEDFNYPNSDRIKEAKGIPQRGDGLPVTG